MKYIRGNIFYPETYRPTLPRIDAICIPTNGFTRRDGTCVMGRGVAQQAAEIFPKMPKALGTKINLGGNNVHALQFDFRGMPVNVVSFPVKPQKDAFSGSNVVAHMRAQFCLGDPVPGWACKAQLSIIKRSCKQLLQLVDSKDWKAVVLPQVGCGAGELDWADVNIALANILDDRFYCITLVVDSQKSNYRLY